MADIFISYAREDRARIAPLAHALEAQGWSVWWDQKIPVGKTFEQMIRDELAAARCVIVAWSKTSLESHWVRDEAGEGCKRNILFPILLDQVEPPLGFRQIHAADLSKWRVQSDHPAIEQIISDISKFLGKKYKEKESRSPNNKAPIEVATNTTSQQAHERVGSSFEENYARIGGSYGSLIIALAGGLLTLTPNANLELFGYIACFAAFCHVNLWLLLKKAKASTASILHVIIIYIMFARSMFGFISYIG